MKEKILGYLLYFVPKNLLSFVVGVTVHVPFPEPLRGWSINWFIKRYKLNMEEAEYPVGSYDSIGQVFTRRLKPGMRPIGSGFVHPADGHLTVTGRIYNGELIQAKGKKYLAKDFLGEEKAATDFEEGMFLTYYLCPTDYHRVHFPMSGKVEKVRHIPGRLWPVNPWSVGHISQLFSINERVVVWLKTDNGTLAIVMVGATNVGKMTLSFEPSIVTNQSHWHKQSEVNFQGDGLDVTKGDELGTFHMGSTVIVLAPKSFFDGKVELGRHPVKIGGSLADLLIPDL